MRDEIGDRPHKKLSYRVGQSEPFPLRLAHFFADFIGLRS